MNGQQLTPATRGVDSFAALRAHELRRKRAIDAIDPRARAALLGAWATNSPLRGIDRGIARMI
jgi:hypothetical protein